MQHSSLLTPFLSKAMWVDSEGSVSVTKGKKSFKTLSPEVCHNRPVCRAFADKFTKKKSSSLLGPLLKKHLTAVIYNFFAICPWPASPIYYLMFPSKAGAYPSEVPCRCSTIGDSPAFGLGWRRLSGTNTLAYYINL